MIIGIDFGHTLKGANYGAAGFVKESEETRRIGLPLIKELEARGHKVVNITVDYASSNGESLNTRVKNANKQHLDLVISVHLNASNGQGHGVEVLTYNGNQLPEAVRICKEIEKLGYRNRGIKNGTVPRKLAIINNVKAKAMIVECFFCDNKEDVNRYKPDAIARAIAEGVGGVGGEIIDKPTYDIPSDNILYKVQTGAFSDEQNALNKASELRDKGIDTYIVKEQK